MPKDFQTISLQEGMTIVFPFDHSITLYGLFAVMAFASTNLSGQAVTCQSFLPNIHLSLQSQWEINEDQQELKQVWHVIQGFLYFRVRSYI